MGAVVGQDDLGADQEVGAAIVGNGFRCLLNQRAFPQMAMTENRKRRPKGHESGARALMPLLQLQSTPRCDTNLNTGVTPCGQVALRFFAYFSIYYDYLLTVHFNRLA